MESIRLWWTRLGVDEEKQTESKGGKISFSLTSLLQIFCPGCFEVDQRCLSRLILAPQMSSKIRSNPPAIETHSTFQQLQESVKNGCQSCQLWLASILRECYLDGMIEDLERSEHPVLVHPPTSTARPWIIRVEAKTAKGESLYGRLLLENATYVSTPVIPKLKAWYQECYSDFKSESSKCFHRKCFENRETTRNEREAFRPKRLLDLRQYDEKNGLIRLIYGDNLDTNEPYVALSYCWGNSTNYRTMRSNETQHQIGISVKNLPQTIKDAVQLCTQLKIFYLWVDALCILQDRDAVEWSEEAGNIDKIYGSAVFTLAVSSSANSNDGFLDKIQQQAPDVSPFLQATMAHHRLQLAPKSLQEVKQRSPLDTRGWAFQEERLSPRIVYFTSFGVFWTCLSGHRSELDTNLLPNKRGQPWSYFQDFSSPEYQDFEDGTIMVKSINQMWSQLIEAYSVREFTKRQDRLPALSGLARKYLNEIQSEELDFQYLAGHWSNSLHSELLWILGRQVQNQMERKKVSRLSIAPSWSWVSVPLEAGVRFPRRYGRSMCKLVNAETSSIESTRICIRGKLRPLLSRERLVTWPEEEVRDEFGYPAFPRAISSSYAVGKNGQKVLIIRNVASPIIIVIDYELPRLERCFCLEINKNGFLLLEQFDEESSFRRVGCAPWHED